MHPTPRGAARAIVAPLRHALLWTVIVLLDLRRWRPTCSACDRPQPCPEHAS
jgi:hypothetical protein